MPITFVQNVLAFVISGLGAAAAARVGVTHKQLCVLISFAAGTLLATALFSIIPETWSSLPFWSLALALTSGYLVFHWISHAGFSVCPACAASHFNEHVSSNFRSMAALLSVALGIHSAMDGMAIATGHTLGEKADLSLFLTVTVHKFPEGLALCALLLKAGIPRIKAWFYTLALESTTFLGWGLGEFFHENFQEGFLVAWLLAHIAGGFVYLAVRAVVNESREHSPRFVLAYFLIGMALIGFTRWLI